MDKVLELTNQERQSAAKPCRPLIFHEKLNTAATAHTEDMIDREYFAHELPGDPSTRLDKRLERQNYRFLTAGENIAYGYPSPQAVMDGWLKSPGHRAKILNCEYSEMGLAMVAKPLPTGRSNLYWTQIFARPR
jgi:uncharacterized protein YkwD